MKKSLVIFLIAVSVFAQTKGSTPLTTGLEELKDFEVFDLAKTIDTDVAAYKKSFDQRVQDIKYVLGLVGITSETTLQEAIGKDATCLRLDTAIRLLADQRQKIKDTKIFKKAEENKKVPKE